MIRLSIPDMSCGHCEKSIRQAVREADQDARVTIDLNSRTADIETTRPLDAVSGAIAKAGYPNSPLNEG
jgi:copper chaperone